MGLIVNPYISKNGGGCFVVTSDVAPYPPALVTGLDVSGFRLTRNGSPCAVHPRWAWLSEQQDTAVVECYPLCGGVDCLAFADGGEGYTSIPMVTVTGGSDVVLGTPILRTGITSYTVISPGSGQPLPPKVTFADSGGGTGAKGHVVIFAGRIGGVVVDAGGSGYTAATTVTISGGASGSGATATPIIASGIITGVLVTRQGTAYPSPPAVTVQAPPNLGGPLGSIPAKAYAVVYDALGSDGAGANAGGIRGVFPMAGAQGGCGYGYSGTTATATVAGGTGIAIVGVVSKYVADVPVTSAGADHNAAPTFTFSGGGATRQAAAVAQMTGPISSDTFTYTAPAGWITAKVGTTTYSAPAATAAAVTNSVGVREPAIGTAKATATVPNLIAGVNMGQSPVDPQSSTSTYKNLLLRGGPWAIASGGEIGYQIDDATPASWTPGMIPHTLVYSVGWAGVLDQMQSPNYMGDFTAWYVDPNINTPSAQPFWLDSVQTWITATPKSLTGDAAPVAIPTANVTIAGGAITAVSLAGMTLAGTYQAAGIFGQGMASAGFAASVNLTAGTPTSVNVICGGTGFVAPPQLYIHGLAVAAGNKVRGVYHFAYTSSNPAEWRPWVTAYTASPASAWAIGTHAVTPPNLDGTANASFDWSAPLATDDNVVAALTAANGRVGGSVRAMDRTESSGGLSWLSLPSDLPGFQGTQKWRTLTEQRYRQQTFRWARYMNTDPASPTYTWSTTKLYWPTAIGAMFDPPRTMVGATTLGSPVVTLPTGIAGTGLLAASTVSGPGIPAGAHVAFFGMQTTGTLTNGSTAVTSVTVNGVASTAGIQVGMDVVCPSVPFGATVTAVSPTHYTLSLAATVTGADGLFLGDDRCFTLGSAAGGLAAATATAASATLTIQSPGYTPLPTSDDGAIINNNFGSQNWFVFELESTVEHGMITYGGGTGFSDVRMPYSGGGATAAAGNFVWAEAGAVLNGTTLVSGIPDAALYVAGAVVAGTGIPAGAKIASVDPVGLTLTLTMAATLSGPATIYISALNFGPGGGGGGINVWVTGPKTIAITHSVLGNKTMPTSPLGANFPQVLNSTTKVDLASAAFPTGAVVRTVAPNAIQLEAYDFAFAATKQSPGQAVHVNFPVACSDGLAYLLGQRAAALSAPGTPFYTEFANETWNNAPGFVAGQLLCSATLALTYYASGVIAGHALAPMTGLAASGPAHQLMSARVADQFTAGLVAGGRAAGDVVRGVGGWWGGPSNTSATNMTATFLAKSAGPWNLGFQMVYIAPYYVLPGDTAVTDFMAPLGSPRLQAGGWPIRLINDFCRWWQLYATGINAQTAAHKKICDTYGVRLGCYEGSLQQSVPATVPLQPQLVHDSRRHPSGADVIYEWYQSLSNAGVDYACYYQCYSYYHGPSSEWGLSFSAACGPGLDPDAGYATYQGGRLSDMHDHGQWNAVGARATDAYLAGLIAVLEDQGPLAVPPPLRTRRWFAGLSRSTGRH